MTLAYSTKYSNEEITEALKSLKDTEAFEIIMFMLLYGDMDELISSPDAGTKLEARRLLNDRLFELFDKYEGNQ